MHEGHRLTMKNFMMMFLAGILTSIGARPPGQRLREVMVQRCAGYSFYGRCWCRSASTCLFRRCPNCDMPTDQDGKALLDDFYMDGVDRHAGPCPDCGGPMRKL